MRFCPDSGKQGEELERVDSLLVVKRQAKDLAERQLRRRITRLEEELQAAADANRPGEELVHIQRRTNRYRDELKRLQERLNYAEQIEELEASRRNLQAQLEQIAESLIDPMADLKLVQEHLVREERILAEARVKLSELMLTAGERLLEAEPPILNEVRITGTDGEVYRAHWNPARLELGIRIHNLEELMREQQQMVSEREDQLEYWEERVLEQQRDCDRLMDAYQDAIWDQFWQSVVVELCDSALSICWDAKTLGPYAVFLEAGDRLLKAATGTAARNYEIPDSPTSNGVFASTAVAQQAGASRNAIKSTILSAIGTAATPADASEFLGYGTSGLRITHEGGRLTSVSTAMARIYDSAVSLPSSIQSGEIWESMRNIDLSGKWSQMTRNIDEKVFRNVRGAGADFTRGFIRDQVQGAAIEELLSQIEDDRRRAWFDYAAADTRRSVALANFKSTAALRRVDQNILAVMQEVLDELIEERNGIELRRTLYRAADEPLQAGREYTVELAFSSRHVTVQSVTIGGLEVSPIETGPASHWSGTILIDELPVQAELQVEAADPDTQKRLDSDAASVARFVPETDSWSGFEPGVDRNHSLRIDPNAVQRSFVFLVDCSGSMNDNNRMDRAKAAAAQIFESGRFQPGDELALYIFYRGAILRPVGFTQDHELVLSEIQSLEIGGGTPLAASIVEAGSYLYANGRGEQRALIVLTDGEDTEGGDVSASVAALREMRQQVEMRLQ